MCLTIMELNEKVERKMSIEFQRLDLKGFRQRIIKDKIFRVMISTTFHDCRKTKEKEDQKGVGNALIVSVDIFWLAFKGALRRSIIRY